MNYSIAMIKACSCLLKQLHLRMEPNRINMDLDILDEDGAVIYTAKSVQDMYIFLNQQKEIALWSKA